MADLDELKRKRDQFQKAYARFQADMKKRDDLLALLRTLAAERLAVLGEDEQDPEELKRLRSGNAPRGRPCWV